MSCVQNVGIFFLENKSLLSALVAKAIIQPIKKKKFSSYTMSPLEFNQQVFKAFVYGGIFSAAVFTTTYLIDQLHDHHYDLKFLSDRVDRVKEKQDLNESKENTG